MKVNEALLEEQSIVGVLLAEGGNCESKRNNSGRQLHCGVLLEEGGN